MASEDWHSDFYPPDVFEDAPKEPAELADQLSPDARAALVAEAVVHYRNNDDWPRRRATFLRRVAFFEKLWFP